MSSELPSLSLVIPCYNEEENLRPLLKAIRESVEPLKVAYEVLITDDCSKDKSWEILKELAANDGRIRVQRFAFNCGESAASWAGLKAARGKYLITLDADLQNDPKDLPKFLDALKKSAQVKNEFGDDALHVIAGRGIRLSEVLALLRKKKETGMDLVDLVIEGERDALRRRYFVSQT